MQNNQTTDFHDNSSDRQPILNLGWDEIKSAVDSLCYQIKFFKPILVVGVSRGGLIPATMISHRLNLPLETINANTYEGTRRILEKPTRIEGWEPGYNTNRVIVVDDIMDSGQTYRAILAETGGITPKFRFATLIDKTPRSFPDHSLYYSQVSKNVWVRFPWELES